MDKFKGKRNTNGFDKNPQNINKSGANRKSFGKFNQFCKELGIPKISETEYLDTISYIFNLPEKEIKELASDKEMPIILRLMIAELTDENTRGKTIQDFRDRLFGKNTQTINNNIEMVSIKPIEWVKDNVQDR